MSDPRYGRTTLVGGRATGRHTRVPGLCKVPQIVALFWSTKALTTAFGESTSDWMVHAMPPVGAVLIGLVVFCIALALQLRAPAYSPWRYWFAVAMVGVFGTMAADVLHVGFGVPYAVSSVFFAVVLAAVFVGWYRLEGTLSVHSITTPRRELFYWAAVVFTFALGTAVGDLTAVTLGLGYLASAIVFAVLIVVPGLAYRFLGLNAVAAFWTAYVLTRPLGASIADWLGKPTADGGLGVGSGVVSVVLGLLIVGSVGYLASSGADTPADQRSVLPAAAEPELG
ncbi:MAG TPA: hypothetical protein VFH38_09825 [Jatrophihabitans sp.]|nr:hypothetical protein [Jatrophihabitans sp.]